MTFVMTILAHAQEVRVHVGSGVWETAPLPTWPQGLLVVDESVYRHHGDALDRLMGRLTKRPLPALVLSGGERVKDSRGVPAHWEAVSERGLGRRDVIVAAGGGTVLDLGGFLAATWMRGVDWISVPTTLLAQVDAGLGGKCGVNLGPAKNQVGAIYQPREMLADIRALETLPKASRTSGFGEVIKTAFLVGGPLLEAVMDRGDPAAPDWTFFVRECLTFKARVVEEDVRESGRRAVLNFGHTVGHVLEGLSAAQGQPWDHGLAVGAGMLAESRMFGLSAVCSHLERALERWGLPAVAPTRFDAPAAERLLRQDKKGIDRDGVWVPRVDHPGSVALIPATLTDLLEAVRRACSPPPSSR